MTSQLDSVSEACKSVSRQVQEAYKNLHIHYIIHHSGQRREALAMAAQEILHHPAAETALHMMQKVRKSEDSAMLGTSVATRHMFFGLASQEMLLSLCTINLEQFRTFKEAQRFAWHLAWHAIDAHMYHDKPENRIGQPQIILRRRNALEMAGANLRADAFSAVMSALNGDLSAIRGIGVTRGLNALQTRSLHNPEFYPFVLAKEATDFAAQDLLRQSPPKKQYVPLALRAASDIGRMIDNESLRHWLAFSEPAQDMAWRGFSPEDILGAAINTSDNTLVRATGHLVADLTGIKATMIMDAKSVYSPFSDDTLNEKLHDKTVESVFEDVIAQGIKQRSADPFLRTANRQNESLTEGNILGWCASALQSAGKVYQRALETGNEESEDTIRREFEGERKSTSWKDLRTVGKEIIHENRQGNIVTLGKLEKIVGDDKAFASIRRAIITTTRDPEYQQKLEAARDLSMDNAPRPTAAPEVAPRAAPSTPAPSRAAMPGLGGGGGGRSGGLRTAPPPQTDKAATGKADQQDQTGR
jgi:hypothetical protein